MKWVDRFPFYFYKVYIVIYTSMTMKTAAIPNATLRKLILQDKPLHHGMVHRVVKNKPGKLIKLVWVNQQIELNNYHNNNLYKTSPVEALKLSTQQMHITKYITLITFEEQPRFSSHNTVIQGFANT